MHAVAKRLVRPLQGDFGLYQQMRWKRLGGRLAARTPSSDLTRDDITTEKLKAAASPTFIRIHARYSPIRSFLFTREKMLPKTRGGTKTRAIWHQKLSVFPIIPIKESPP